MPALDQVAAQRTLGELLPDAVDASSRDLLVSGLQLDSRSLQSGDLFMAFPGEQHDGRDYLAEAAAVGAVACVVERGLTQAQRDAASGLALLEVDGLAQQVGNIAARFYGHPSARMHLVGITGTNGKTTTSRLLAQLLRGAHGQCGVIGTLGASLDDAAADAANTTPDAISLQAQLAGWLAQGVQHAVLEVSSHALEQGRVNGLEFDTAVFTNLTHDHLDYHGDMASYGAAKARLFAFDGLAGAVVNADDPYAATIAASCPLQVLGYSVAGGAFEEPASGPLEISVTASDLQYRAGGLQAWLRSPWGDGELNSPLAGEFNLSNLLAAISAACLAGVPLPQVLREVPALRGVPGRMEYVPNQREIQAVVDYAHTPDALRQALQALRAHTGGELICVFGCGGDRDAEKRPVMGAIASECADRAVVTSDNPRNENPMSIIDHVVDGMSGAYEVEPDRAAAIRRAVELAQPGDAILVAGKGHETYQQLGSERFPFSDVSELRLALAAGGES